MASKRAVLEQFTRDELVAASSKMLHVLLTDGREISVPLARYPKLASATPAQLANWCWIGGGVGIHWPDLDEDLSIRSMLALG